MNNDNVVGAEQPGGAQTAARCIALLEFLARQPEPMLLREIADELGVTRTAVYRLLVEFAKRGLVTKSPDHRYGVGPGLVALAARIAGGAPLRQGTREVLEAISAATGETVSLHLRTNEQRVCIESVESDQPIRRVVPLGQTLPLYAGPTGKVILAFLPEEQREAVLARAAGQHVDVIALRAQLDAVREAGYLAGVGDRIPGVGGLSLALFGANGAIAAITISGPSERWGMEQMEAAVPAVARFCGEFVDWAVSRPLAAAHELEVAVGA